jgi:hypothetical protein
MVKSIDGVIFKLHCSAPLSDLLVNPWLNKSKRAFSSGGARTHTSGEMLFFCLMLYQLSYRGLMLEEAKYKLHINICIFHHFSIIS